jgi:predicted esterase
LLAEGKPVANGVFEAVSGSAMAQCVLKIRFPPPGNELGALDIVVNSEACGQVEIPSINEARARTFQWQKPRAYPGCVFSGATFPGVNFDNPLWIENLVGTYAISTVYYDADYNEVKSAEKPGRYGAVAEIATEGGDVYRRCVTLFRQAEDVNWRDEEGLVPEVKLPPGLGIDPEVVRKQQDTLASFVKWQTVSGLSEEPYGAILLAGLSEMRPGDKPAVERTGVEARNQKWWARLQDKLGVLDVPHLVLLPQDYDNDKDKQWPLVLFLHGAGERGEDVETVRRHGIPKLITNGQSFPFIVVAPQCHSGSWWTTETENLALLLDKVVTKYRVDTNRVYCTGLSMGGYGTWSLSMAYPERFAAIAPICGGGDVHDVARIKDVPIWAFHGAKDDTVPVERTQKLIDALKDIGVTPRFTVYPDASHNSWDETYDNPELYEWMLKQSLSNRK